MLYGVFMDGLLLEKHETPIEAYESAIFGYEETGVFHEVRKVHPQAKTIYD